MPYDEELADRIRGALLKYRKVEEKKMFGFLVFMVNGRMCLGVRGDEMMCRIGPDSMESVLRHDGCAPLRMKRKTSLNMIMVEESGMRTKKEFDFWVDLALQFNLGRSTGAHRKANRKRRRK
jgi:hypothetical protein